ncbi:MAG: histidine kinase, partial [Ramlibacter sp.]
WSKYAAVTMALSVLLIVGLRFKRAREDLVTLNQSIQHRIEEREIELKTQYARLNLLEREKATADERARILRDMHDGAGAHLIAAIHQIESGDASSAELLETLGESLDQLRLTVDAMNLPDGDIGGLLGSLRFRLERRIAAAGLRLRWTADELPVLAHFGGTQMRHVQFILIEAISNVIQHARASELTISATCAAGQIELLVRDNGVGPGGSSGNGLRTMKERAAIIDADLQFEAAGPGLRIRLTLEVVSPHPKP